MKTIVHLLKIKNLSKYVEHILEELAKIEMNNN